MRVRDGTGRVEASKALQEVLADLKTKTLACDGWGNKRLPEVFLVANSTLQGTQEPIHGPYVTFLSPRTAVMVIIWWSYLVAIVLHSIMSYLASGSTALWFGELRILIVSVGGFPRTFKFIQNAQQNNRIIFVHCKMGMSRYKNLFFLEFTCLGLITSRGSIYLSLIQIQSG